MRARLQDRQDQEEGFTLVETLVTLVVVSIILTLILGFVTNLVQQSTNVRDTMTGVQQDQTAGEALLQYLHGTIVILPGSTATILNASILAGVNSTSVPQTATLKSVLTPSSNPKFDATFTTSLSPDGVHYSNVSTYDAVNSSNVFTYWYNNYNVTPVTLASTTAPTNAELSEIVAVGIDVTFLAGPQVPTRGFAVRATSFESTIYLQNASGAPAPTTSVSVAASTSSGTFAVGSPVTLTATVSPVPDGGTVTFTVTQGATPLSMCTAPVAVSTTDGTAVCSNSFIPPSGGTYDVTAAFSGTSDFQPSTSGTTLVVVPIATSLSISGAATATTITITATLTPSSGPTGTINWKLQSASRLCTTYTGSIAYPGATSWEQMGVRNNCTYTATASYVGNSAYAASTASPITVSTT